MTTIKLWYFPTGDLFFVNETNMPMVCGFFAYKYFREDLRTFTDSDIYTLQVSSEPFDGSKEFMVISTFLDLMWFTSETPHKSMYSTMQSVILEELKTTYVRQARPIYVRMSRAN
jgi:hypothetical protein